MAAPDAPRVLIVDDYPDAIDVWELYLTSEGFEVLTAVNGQVALQTALDEKPDVLVMDLELPGLSGYEVARRLRAADATRDIPLIAATGCSHETQLAEARAIGFDTIFVKPCDPGELVHEIRRLIAARPAVS